MAGTQAPAPREDVERLLAEVRQQPPPAGGPAPALAVLVGLPASGKTAVAEALRARTGAAVLESDALRRLLFPRRTYSPAESGRLFAAIHGAIEALLREGVSVVLDATNVAESERAPLYRIAEEAGARLVLVRVTAPDELVRHRLTQRAAEAGSSEADIGVYERMRTRVEKMRRPHHVVDTSQDIRPLIAAVAKEMMAP